MSETWEQTKARLKKQGISLDKDIVVIKPVARYTEPIKQREPERIQEKLFNIHKRSLPVGIDKIVVFNAPKADATWWVESKLKTKCYENGADDSKTIIYYDIIPVGASPKEKSVYYNMADITTEPVVGFNVPKRIN